MVGSKPCGRLGRNEDEGRERDEDGGRGSDRSEGKKFNAATIIRLRIADWATVRERERERRKRGREGRVSGRQAGRQSGSRKKEKEKNRSMRGMAQLFDTAENCPLSLSLHCTFFLPPAKQVCGIADKKLPS